MPIGARTDYKTFHDNHHKQSDQSYWIYFKIWSHSPICQSLTGFVIATLNHKAMYSDINTEIDPAFYYDGGGLFRPELAGRSAKEKCFNFCKLFQLIHLNTARDTTNHTFTSSNIDQYERVWRVNFWKGMLSFNVTAYKYIQISTASYSIKC